MKTFFNAAFFRAAALMLLVVVLCVAIWVFGPVLALGALRPLEGVGARVAVMGLLLAFTLLWVAGKPVSPVFVIAAALLVWTAGPLLAVGASRPLQEPWVRAAFIGVIVLLYLVWAVWRLLHAIGNDRQLLDRLLGRKKAEAELAQDEIRTMRDIARRAVARLRDMRSTGGWLRVMFEGRRYLYELPWYVVIGNAGAGKTSAVQNAGLRFPVLPELSTSSIAAQAGGTLQCGWWFTDEAVLVDTAGRFTRHVEGAGLASTGPTSTHAPAADRPNGDEEKAGTEAQKEEGVAPHPGATAPADPGRVNAAAWRGLLGVLRHVRPRAPVNGALLMVDASRLMASDAPAILSLAADLRARLEEMRAALGVRFPVYVVLTKCDALNGFAEYFASLTAEARAQVWGVTLPWESAGHSFWRRRGGRSARAAEAQARFGQALRDAFKALESRVSAGVEARLQEEFDPKRRDRLYDLPHELEGLTPALLTLLEEAFADSRFDATSVGGLLRGVYLTSAVQFGDAPLKSTGWRGAEPRSVMALLMERLGLRAAPDTTAIAAADQAVTRRGYFLHDLITRVIVPESHLVRPNLRLEARLRLAGWLGHSLVALLLVWLGSALWASHANNAHYLQGVMARAGALRTQVQSLFADFRAAQVPEALGAAQDVAHHPGIDLADPPAAWRYGLYTGDDIQASATQVYAALQDHLLLPTVVARMEKRLAQAVADQDARAAYETLRVYLMLFDPARHAARDLRGWIVQDWQAADGLAASFGGRAAMLGHLQSLFSGDRVVRSARVPDAPLVQRVRDWLDGTTASERLYERAKAQLADEAPADFTLVRALGPQAGTLFMRASGRPLEQGVPGLFTYDGYHQAFSPRLADMIARAADDDAWVMGQRQPAAGQGVDAPTQQQQEAQALAQEVRRQFLQEYAKRWAVFLDDVRVIGGANLAFDLNVLRQLAAPDSPLARLARAAARETTLSAPLVAARGEADNKSLLDKAGETLDKTREAGRALGLRAEARIERMEVDDRFAALREVVTGQVDAAALAGTAAASRPPALEAITGLINDYYTVLVVADTALTGGAVPPGVADVGARLRLEAQRLPAPFREVLLGLGTEGASKVSDGAQTVLRQQARAQLDRINGLLALQVTEPCRRALEGRYPFAAGDATGNVGAGEVAAEDFQLLFATGGAFDDYFARNLMPYADLSVRPWRYKSPATASMLVPATTTAEGAAASAPAPAVAGPTLAGELLRLLAEQGPELDVFWRAAQIRNAYFKEGGRRLGWQTDVRVSEIDPSITELVMDFDGQAQRYAHGPVQAWMVSWPGPRGGASAELVALPRIRAETSALQARGPWALQRLMERGRIVGTATAGRVAVEFSFDGRRAVLDLSGTGSQAHPLMSQSLREFRCPGGRRSA